MTDALIHLRVPASLKARWVRDSRAEGKKLTDWIVDRVESAGKTQEHGDQMIEIQNDGPEIASTNYWQTEHAARGLLYLTANAGVLRLLVPGAAADMLAEMRTGTSVTIERSLQDPHCVDVVFEDGSDSPFFVAVDKRQIDRKLDPGACRFVVWTPTGKAFELPCNIAQFDSSDR